MNAITIFSFITVGILAIDMCMRLARYSKSSAYDKAAGILPLIFLAISQKRRPHEEKKKALKQFFLSSIIVAFLCVSLVSLLVIGIPKETNVLHFGLLLTPLFTLPFFHLLYDLISVHPLTIRHSLINFRLRGSLALIMSANIIFLSLEAIQHVVIIIGHFALAFMALISVFFLCSCLRKKIPYYEAPLKGTDSSFEPMILRYLASILELFYYFVLLFLIFMKGPLEGFLPTTQAMHVVMPCLLLIFATVFVKIRFYMNTPISLEFYEQKALPLSFLFFGLTSIFRYYF